MGEMGRNMKCSNCQKSLMCHTLQQSEPKMTLQNPSKEGEFMERKRAAEARLKIAVEKFKSIAPANNFGRIINQSMAYLQAVKEEHIKKGEQEKAQQVNAAIAKFQALRKAD